ncbi:putative Polycystic kidney disease protein 1-like 1, partial [Homarus americanus]
GCFLGPLIGALADGALPGDLQWLFPKHVEVDKDMAFFYQITHEVPPFFLSMSVDNVVIEALSFAGQQATLNDVVWVYRALTQDNVTLNVPTLIVTPPGTASAAIDVSSEGELPTLLTGTITWGDGLPDTDVNLTQFTQPGAVGIIAESYSHNYTDNGKFSVQLSIGNPISNVQVTGSVSV